MLKKLGTTAGQKEKLDQLLSEAGVRSDDWQRGYDEGQLQVYVRALAQGRRIEIVKFVPTYDPRTGIYCFEVNYDETLEQKLVGVSDATTNTIGWATSCATDANYPSTKKGVEVVSARIVFPNEYTPQNSPKLAGGLGPKELIDFAKAFPRPMLDGDMPLAAPSQFWAGPGGRRSFLCLGCLGTRRELGHVWLDPDAQWVVGWRFLVRAKPLVS